MATHATLADSPVLTQDPSHTKVDSSPPINSKRSSNAMLICQLRRKLRQMIPHLMIKQLK